MGAGYQMTNNWGSALPGIDVPRQFKYTVYSSFLIKDLINANTTHALKPVKLDQ